MTRDEARQLIYDRNKGLIEITEEQKSEILQYFTEQDMREMIDIQINCDHCFDCSPPKTVRFNN